MLNDLMTVAKTEKYNGWAFVSAANDIVGNMTNEQIAELDNEINTRRFSMFVNGLNGTDKKDAQFCRESALRIIAGRLEMINRQGA